MLYTKRENEYLKKYWPREDLKFCYFYMGEKNTFYKYINYEYEYFFSQNCNNKSFFFHFIGHVRYGNQKKCQDILRVHIMH